MAVRRKPKRKAGMGYFTILLLILILFAAVGVFISRRFAPSKSMADLADYYNLTAYESINRAGAGPDELAIVLNDRILDNEDTALFRAVRSDDGVYVGLSMVQELIDKRFYLDQNQNLVIFTNAVASVLTTVDTGTYTVEGEEKDAGYVPARTINGSIYLNMKFVEERTGAAFKVLSAPDRVFIQTEQGTMDYVTSGIDINIRVEDNKKSSIVAVVPSGSRMRVLAESSGWMKVIDENGYIGYVQTNFLNDKVSGTSGSDFTEPEYTHITMDEKVNMVWHGIYYYDSNAYVRDYTYEMTGVNVMAPTWFLFSDTEGNILSYASQDYVDYAHEIGCKVWAVLEDMDGESCVEILPYTYKRQNAISQIVNECLNYGIDGINVDLEKVTTSLGEDFIQFIRELSAACRNNGLVLSVDDYAPYSYNAYRHTDEQSKLADYVAVMAYDDFVGENTAGPNAGLPFVEEVLGLCANTVDMDRLIVGIPFYTRLWYEYGDGSLGSDTRDMKDIENIVWNHGLTFEWQTETGYDYAEYEYDGATVKLWYENVNSLEAKLKLISQYNVAGVASWRLGQEKSEVWNVLSKYY